MQQYQNPNYYMQYQQPQFNPYMQRMENLQQFQQAIQQPVTMQNQQMTPLIKVVENIDMVKVADIPMDGNMYYFPKADGMEIYSKQFMPNGQTRILTFRPFVNDEVDNPVSASEKAKYEEFNNVLMGIQNDIKTLTDKIDKISKPVKAKKEVSEDE